MSHSGRRIQIIINKNKNYVMLILHQAKLMTSNGSSIQLILLEMIKERYEHTLEEMLQETPVRFEMNEATMNEWRYMRMKRS